MFPINEYKLIRIIKHYVSLIKNEDALFDSLLNRMFLDADVDVQELNAIKDVIKNEKIDYRTAYNNLSAVLPTVVVMMDRELAISADRGIGSYIGPTEGEESIGDDFGYMAYGDYTITVYSKQMFLTRALNILIKMFLEHYQNNNSDNIYDIDISSDRFNPDADYLPSDVFRAHMILRFKYLENYSEIYSLISDIYMMHCGTNGEFHKI